MKPLIRALAFAAVALPALAQYAPPARDLADVNRLGAEFQRLAAPALAEVGAYSDALLLMTSVHQTLKDEPTPLIAIDKAIDKLDSYMRRHERDDPPLPRDVVRFIKIVHTWLDEVKMGPPPTDLLVLRQRLHLEVIHPMQRTVLMQAIQMQQIARNLQAIANSFDGKISSNLGAAQAAATSGTTP